MKNVYWQSYDQDLNLEKRNTLGSYKQAEEILDQFVKDAKEVLNETDGDLVLRKTYLCFSSDVDRNEYALAVNIMDESEYHVSFESFFKRANHNN